MKRETLIIGTSTAWHRARFDACTGANSGRQILTLSQLAARLAGGFISLVKYERLQELASEALKNLVLQEMEAIRTLPGTARAVIGTLQRSWEAGLELSGYAENPRVQDLLKIEASIRASLKPGEQLLPDLIAQALKNIAHAPKLLGEIHLDGVVWVDPCWQGLLASLAKQVKVSASIMRRSEAEFAWARMAGIQLEYKQPHPETRREAVQCANPRQEVVEALRWVRELLASGVAKPHEIAIITCQIADYDDDARTLVRDSQLPVYFPHGVAAVSEGSGQRAAALAEVLRNGLSQRPSDSTSSLDS